MDILTEIQNALSKTGIRHSHIKRPQVLPCIVYYYNEYPHAAGDNKEESSKYDVYINLITKDKITQCERTIKSALSDAGFIKVVINAPEMFKDTDYYQITMNYIKILNEE